MSVQIRYTMIPSNNSFAIVRWLAKGEGRAGWALRTNVVTSRRECNVTRMKMNDSSFVITMRIYLQLPLGNSIDLL